ncbi:MAG TPA: TlyA family RNA methyltransferase [Candidatus Gallacutalibacter stercoravium]|nr:TlyA family RNA methyltransferase [Candidatus Gallacutalibacter stercoravium]
MTDKKRLDALVLEAGLAPSREKAKAMILSGAIYVDGCVQTKPGGLFPLDAKVEQSGGGLPYVSRGGLKLEKALSAFAIDLREKVAADIGASTGGFTDCMLQNGAARVYAVDVGHDQLSPQLRADSRVVNLEGVNARYLSSKEIPQPLDFISVDVSFISLALVLPVVYRLLGAGGTAVCLVKPQFEAGKDKVGKKGVVRDPKVHKEVIQRVCGYAMQEGFRLCGLDFSPVKGPEGNIEFLLYLQKAEKPAASCGLLGLDVEAVVKASHEKA